MRQRRGAGGGGGDGVGEGKEMLGEIEKLYGVSNWRRGGMNEQEMEEAKDGEGKEQGRGFKQDRGKCF